MNNDEQMVVMNNRLDKIENMCKGILDLSYRRLTVSRIIYDNDESGGIALSVSSISETPEGLIIRVK